MHHQNLVNPCPRLSRVDGPKVDIPFRRHHYAALVLFGMFECASVNRDCLPPFMICGPQMCTPASLQDGQGAEWTILGMTRKLGGIGRFYVR